MLPVAIFQHMLDNLVEMDDAQLARLATVVNAHQQGRLHAKAIIKDAIHQSNVQAAQAHTRAVADFAEGK